MSAQKALVKIPLQGKGDVFLMSEYEPKNCLTLKLIDIELNQSYIGRISDLDLRSQAAKIRFTFNDFVENFLKALFQTQEEYSFIYTLEKEDAIHNFKWKSIDHEETVIEIGSIKMSEQNYVSTFDGVLLSLAREIHQLNSKIKALSVDLVDCKNQTEYAMNQVSDTIDIKNNLEKEMHAKFLLVLNEKKRKINELSNRKSHEQTYIDRNHNVHKSKKQKSHTISDSSEDEIFEFHDVNAPGPSTMKKENSLIFSDDDDVSVVPVKPSKMRNRTATIKKRTFDDKIMSSNVESVLSQVIDEDSDDSLIGKL